MLISKTACSNNAHRPERRRRQRRANPAGETATVQLASIPKRPMERVHEASGKQTATPAAVTISRASRHQRLRTAHSWSCLGRTFSRYDRRTNIRSSAGERGRHERQNSVHHSTGREVSEAGSEKKDTPARSNSNLRNDAANLAGRLKPGERDVSGIGGSPAEAVPPERGSSPVPANQQQLRVTA